MQRKMGIGLAIAIVLVASFFLAKWIRPFLVSEYGIDPLKVAFIFVIAEIFFDLGLVIMLWFSGFRKLSWKIIKSLKIKEFRVDWNNPGMMVGLFINRISWVVPFVYIVVVGWGQLPWIVTLGCCVEIGLTLWVGGLAMGLLGPAKPKIVVRPAISHDIDEIVRIDAEVWGNIFPGTRKMFASRIQTFPEGGIVVAEIDGQIEAFVSVQLTNSFQNVKGDWNSLTDYGTIRKTHDPNGEWLYGVGLAATAKASKYKVVTSLLLYIGRLVIRWDKKGVILSSRVPGYKRHAKKMTPESYVLARKDGKLIDPELRVYEQYRLRVINPPVILKDYMGEGSDPDSLGYSVLIGWENPFYCKPFPWLWSHLLKI